MVETRAAHVGRLQQGLAAGGGAVRQLGSRYALERVVGRGATGEVWLAHETDGDGQAVAVKVLRPEYVDDGEVVARFLRERNVLRSVRSAHVVRVRDLVVEGSTLAIVMEYVPRADLRAFLRDNGGAVAPAVAVALTRQILDALDAVHAAGVVHRDVKPENVLVDADADGSPVAKLSDFGVSRLLDGVTLTRVTGLIGTPRYMAPELGSGADPSASSDLYAVGIVLYELLTGRVPFVAEHPVAMLRAHVEQQPARPDGIDPQLWKALAKLLAKKPAARYADAAAAMRDLDAVAPRLEGLPPLTDPRADHTLHPTSQRRHDRRSISVPSFWRRHATDPRVDRVARFQHPRLMLSTATFAAVAMVAALFAVLMQGGAHDTGERAWIDTYQDTGYAVTRDWQLTGKHGDLFEATERVMPIAHPLSADAVYTLVVPKSLAKRRSDITIQGASTVKDDPVLAVPLGALALNSARTVSYTIHVPPKGRHSSRLDQWNKDMLAARRQFGHEATTYKGPREVPKTTRSTPDLSLADQHTAAVAVFTGTRVPKTHRPPTTTTVTPPPPGCDDAHPANCPPAPCDAAHPANCPAPTCDSAHLSLCLPTGLTFDPPTVALEVGQGEVVHVAGQTAFGPAPGDLLAKTALIIDNGTVATVGPLTLDASGVTASFTVQSNNVGSATIWASNGDLAVSLSVQVNPVPPPLPVISLGWGQPDGSACVTNCTLTLSFQQPSGSTEPVTAWTACLEPQDVCIPVSPDTSYTSALDASSGALTGQFSAQIPTDAAGESISVTAAAGQLNTMAVQTIPAPPWQQPTQGTGTTPVS